MKFLALTALLFSVACGDGLNQEEPPTFADGALALSTAFCERSVECDQREPEAVPSCIDSNVYQLCNIWDCERIMSFEEEEMFAQCELDLSVKACTASLSSTCLAVLEF